MKAYFLAETDENFFSHFFIFTLDKVYERKVPLLSHQYNIFNFH